MFAVVFSACRSARIMPCGPVGVWFPNQAQLADPQESFPGGFPTRASPQFGLWTVVSFLFSAMLPFHRCTLEDQSCFYCPKSNTAGTKAQVDTVPGASRHREQGGDLPTGSQGLRGLQGLHPFRFRLSSRLLLAQFGVQLVPASVVHLDGGP